jgi:hypothetical protein
MLIMYDFLSHIDWIVGLLQRDFNDIDRSYNASAETTRLCHDYMFQTQSSRLTLIGCAKLSNPMKLRNRTRNEFPHHGTWPI